MFRKLRITLIACAAICITITSCTKHENPKPVLNLFVMSHCPFGIRAEDYLIGLLGNFKNEITLHVHYIVSKDLGGNFTSLHGPGELDEDLHQIAIQKLFHSSFFNYLLCYNSTMNRKQCLGGSSINPAAVDSFVTSGKAMEILENDYRTTEKRGINSSPTLYINNEKYSGPIQPEHIIRTLCSDIPAVRYCKTLAPPVTVDCKVLTGGWDNIYHPDYIKENLSDFFYKSSVDIIDASSQQGQELLKKLGITAVPVILMSSNVTMTTSYGAIKARLKKTNGEFMDDMEDIGYRHFTDRPAQDNTLVLFLDISSKTALDAGISTLRMLRDYKKYQYHPEIKVIGSHMGADALKTAFIVEHAGKLPFNEFLQTLVRLYKSPSLGAFNLASPAAKAYREKSVAQIVDANDAAAAALGIGKARFAMLINNTELIDAANPSQSVGIFELSPIIGKQAFPAGRQSAHCSK